MIDVSEFIVLVQEDEYMNINITWWQTPTATCHLDIRIKCITLNLAPRCHHIFCFWFNSNVTYPNGTDNLTNEFVLLQDYLEVAGLLDGSSSVCLVGCSFGLRGVLSPDSLKIYMSTKHVIINESFENNQIRAGTLLIYRSTIKKSNLLISFKKDIQT